MEANGNLNTSQVGANFTVAGRDWALGSLNVDKVEARGSVSSEEGLYLEDFQVMSDTAVDATAELQQNFLW